jgi:hypothetical protein
MTTIGMSLLVAYTTCMKGNPLAHRVLALAAEPTVGVVLLAGRLELRRVATVLGVFPLATGGAIVDGKWSASWNDGRVRMPAYLPTYEIHGAFVRL